MRMELSEQLEIDSLLNAIDTSIQQELPGISIRSVYENMLQGTWNMDLTDWLQQILQTLFCDITLQFSFLGQMILLAIVFALLNQMEHSFSSGTIQKMTGLVIQSIAILLLLRTGNAVLVYGQQAVLRLTELIQLFLPIQLLLMTGIGNIQTAGLLKPSLLLMIQGMVWFFGTVLLPLITAEFVLKLVNSFSDTYKLQGIATFLRKFILTVIAFSMMLFLAVLSIQGIRGHVMDSVSLRAAKYITSVGIPVVGSALSGLLETILSGAAMIRNAVGFVGLLAVFLLTFVPAMKLLLIYFCYTFVAALLQPVGEVHITGLLEQAANSYMLLFAVVVLTGVFFFFVILILLAAGGAVLG